MIKTDEWVERKASTRRQLLRARVRREALEAHYERLVAARADSNGPEAAELLVSGEAAEELAALEEELSDARAEHEESEARVEMLMELAGRKAGAEEAEDDNNAPRVGL
jgi:hypothetical protein